MSKEPSKTKRCFWRVLWCIVRKTLKVLLLIVGVLLVFILAGGLGPVVKYVGVPLANSQGVPLSIEKCVILPLGGYVRIEGLQVENPDAFREPKDAAGNPLTPNKVYLETPLLRIGALEFDFHMLSLFKEEKVVDLIRLEGLRALYAFDYDTTNVDAFLAQVAPPGEAPAEPVAETPAKPETEEQPAEAAGELKFRIAQVTFTDNSVTLRKFVNIPMPLPPLSLTDIDNRTLQEKYIDPMIKTVNSGAGDAFGAVGDGVNAVTEGLGTLSTALGEGLDGAGLAEGAKAVGEGAQATLDSVKGLFKKKK